MEKLYVKCLVYREIILMCYIKPYGVLTLIIGKNDETSLEAIVSKLH